MPEPDFESIMKKYRSLLGPGKSPSQGGLSADSTGDALVGEKAQGGRSFQVPSMACSPAPLAGQDFDGRHLDGAYGDPLDRDELLDDSAEGSEQRDVREENRDSFLVEERFIRAPLAADPLQPPSEEGWESVMFNNLFASVEKDEWTSQATYSHAPIERSEPEVEIDLKAADFARRLYHYEMDLRQHYNPDLGMYPGQALYIPKKKTSRAETPTVDRPEGQLPPGHFHPGPPHRGPSQGDPSCDFRLAGGGPPV